MEILAFFLFIYRLKLVLKARRDQLQNSVVIFFSCETYYSLGASVIIAAILNIFGHNFHVFLHYNGWIISHLVCLLA